MVEHVIDRDVCVTQTRSTLRRFRKCCSEPAFGVVSATCQVALESHDGADRAARRRGPGFGVKQPAIQLAIAARITIRLAMNMHAATATFERAYAWMAGLRACNGDGTTLLGCDTDAGVGGAIGSVGRRMLTSVGKRMASDLFGDTEQALTGPRPADATVEGSAPAAASAPTPTPEVRQVRQSTVVSRDLRRPPQGWVRRGWSGADRCGCQGDRRPSLRLGLA